jgi:hypothetical protein
MNIDRYVLNEGIKNGCDKSNRTYAYPLLVDIFNLTSVPKLNLNGKNGTINLSSFSVKYCMLLAQ